MRPKWTKSPDVPVQVALLLFDRFSNLCLANCIEPLRAANTMLAARAFEWSILTPDGRPSRSSSGIDMLAHRALSQIGPVDYLFVLASYDHERHDTPANRRLLRKAARRAEVVVGLDAGPWLLAAAGLLDGRRATVHWDLLDSFRERFAAVTTERQKVLRDGRVLTCAGATSALDLTLDLISGEAGQAARLDVEAVFLYGDPPVAGGTGKEAADPLIRRALALMRDSLERPISLKGLAAQLSCQPRTLDRRFRARLGAAPGQVYRHMRLAAARALIEDSTRSVTEIALLCGYESPAALTRAFRRQYGVSPSALRRTRRAQRE